ncbi:acyltransferase [Klebsiella pneumoniae]|nr:acyltransferase [Klebsiella pneumoniae]HDG7934345.1 acyltransferase [Klebsiella quasipneumoniae]HDS2685481.1 acyltransferase [Klebsiella pneumoniae]
MSNQMINNIQLLRFLAVLMVVLYHSSGTMSVYDINFVDFTGVGHWGAYGVDIFFVISGFIMAMIDDNKKKTPAQFAKDRIKRIVPLYWILTLSIVFLQLLLPSSFNTLTLSSEHVILSLLFISGYADYNYPSLYVGWSLELEMLFYALFSLSLFIKNKRLRVFVVGGAIITLSSLSMINSIAIEFVLGVVVYYVTTKIKEKIIFSWYIFPVSIVIYVFAIWLLSVTSGAGGGKQTIVIGGASMLLVLVAVCCGDLAKKNIMTYIGDASYSVYLVQVFTIPFALRLLHHFFSINGWAAIIIATIFTLGAGVCCYELVECKTTGVLRKIKARFINIA